MSTFDDAEQDQNSGSYIIRLLNTQLSDCLYELPSHGLHFIVAPASELEQDESLLLSEEHILIPDETRRANFSIYLNASGNLILKTSEGERYIPVQKVIEHQSVFFAAKLADDEAWVRQISEFREPDAINTPDDSLKNGTMKYALAAAGILLICMLAGFAWWLQGAEQREKNSLYQAVDGKKGNYIVVRGNDKKLYVVADGYSDYIWADRALQKSQQYVKAVVLSKQAESKRIADMLRAHWPELRFHRVNIDNLLVPEITLSEERNPFYNEEAAPDVRNGLLQLLPYARDISFKTISDKTVLEQAENGLQKNAVMYSKDVKPDSVIFRITGALQDNELNALKDEVLQFNDEWQGMYIAYYIELENDWLKGKSYKYGDDGYVKMTPGHWYFPSPLQR